MSNNKIVICTVSGQCYGVFANKNELDSATSVRKFVTIFLVVAIALIGALPQHYAMAGKHGQHDSKIVAPHAHGTVAEIQGYATVSCDDHGENPSHAPSSDQACCASACVAVAMIFAQFDFGAPGWSQEFSAFPVYMLHPAPQTPIDRPPRYS